MFFGNWTIHKYGLNLLKIIRKFKRLINYKKNQASKDYKKILTLKNYKKKI